MSALLRDWDEGSKNKRKKLLEWFCNRFDPALDGGDLLESECGADIALFLPRLLSWMQKTTASVVNLSSDSSDAEPRKTKCFVLSEQVACLQVFFGAANVQSYYREFQQADGLQLLLKIVALPGNRLQNQQPLISTTDRGTLLRIILRISQMNRSCKEEISRLDGELAVIRGVLASGSGGDWKTESHLWTLCREVLLEQLVGNPNGLDRAHAAVVFMLEHPEAHLQLFGAQVLRELITTGCFSFDPEYRSQKERELVPLCMTLLNSPDVYIQHEALELLHALLQSRHLQDLICEALVILTGDAAKTLDGVDERLALVQETTEYETYAHLHSAFVVASQAVNTLVHSNRNLLPILVDRFDILTPLAFVLVVERPQSLKWLAAAITMRYIFVNHQQTAAVCLAELFAVPAVVLLSWKDSKSDDGQLLAEFLLHDDDHQRQLALKFYQRGWYRPLDPRRPPKQDDIDRVLNDIQYSLETTARDYIPELQVESRISEDDDDVDEMETLEALRERRLRIQLQKHFAKFRSVSAVVAIGGD